MLKYLNGVINKSIPDEKTLTIALSSDETGQPLDINLIIEQYKKFITCICFIGGNDQISLTSCCKTIHKNGLKTGFFSESQVNKQLEEELDYLKTGKTVMKKDVCPFGDIIDWVEI